MKRIFKISMLLALALVLVACQGKDTADTDQVTENQELVKVTTNLGDNKSEDIEVAKNPQRIVVLDNAVLDLLDTLGYGDRVVAMPLGNPLEYQKSYAEKEGMINAGTLKQFDLEAIMSAKPDLIMMGGRGIDSLEDLRKIAPVVSIIVGEDGVVNGLEKNLTTVAKIFGAEDKVEELMKPVNDRIAALKEKTQGKSAIIGLVTNGGFNVLDNSGRMTLITNELGFENVGQDIQKDESAEAAHGNETTFEFLLDKNPEYIFVLDRDSAIATEGAKLASEIMDNDIVNKTQAAQDGKVIVLEHSGVWYTAEGGYQGVSIMLDDIEAVIK